MSISTRATAPKKQLKLRQGRLSQAALSQIIQSLRQDGVAIFPTETVYGIGASAFSHRGIRRIYQLKGRRWNKPLALLVPTLEAAAPMVEEIPSEAFRLAKDFWPGPMTLIFRASALGRLVTGGLETLGVRIPDHPFALELLQKVGLPLATTSVNRSGDEPAVSGVHAAKMFGAKVDWMIDGGVCPIKASSTVLDLSSYPFTVKRLGSISKKDLEHALSKTRSST